MNQVVITGRLANDPVVREIGEDNKVAEFRVAVDRRWAKEGQQSADFIQVKMYGADRADFVAQYFQKGKPIEVAGSLHIDTVKNEDDTYTSYTYIRVDEVNFVLSDKKDGNSGDGSGDGEDSAPRQAPSGRNSTRVVRKPVGTGSGRKRLGL